VKPFIVVFFLFFFSGTHFHLPTRNVSSAIPKSEDAKKRVLKQSQLLDGKLSLHGGAKYRSVSVFIEVFLPRCLLLGKLQRFFCLPIPGFCSVSAFTG